MKYRILMKKLLFLHHLSTLPENSLAAEVFHVQDRLKLPGLARECEEFLIRFRISNVSSYSKQQWKIFVKRQVWQMNKEEILQRIRTYKKIDYKDFETRSLEPQPYLKSMMTPTVRMNFRNNREYKCKGWACPESRLPST